MKCTVCNSEIPVGTGRMLVMNDGRIVTYCSSKCRTNVALGREPRRLKWVTAKK